jgi:hypothetical protein
MRERIETGNFLRLILQMVREAKQGAIHLAQAALSANHGMDLFWLGWEARESPVVRTQ